MAGLPSHKHKSPRTIYTHPSRFCFPGSTWTTEVSTPCPCVSRWPTWDVSQAGTLVAPGALLLLITENKVCVVSPAKAEISLSRLESIGRDRPRPTRFKRISKAYPSGWADVSTLAGEEACQPACDKIPQKFNLSAGSTLGWGWGCFRLHLLGSVVSRPMVRWNTVAQSM